ncbi:MAG: O-antigen ligase family protein [Balneola sp.]
MLIVLTLSLLLTILAPSKVIHSGTVHIGAWKGIYYHKSGFGREMGILGLLLLFTGKGIWRYLVFVLCLFLVYKSQSAISLLTIVGASFYLLTERILSRIKELKNHTNKIILAGIAGFIAFIASDFASFMELIGKDITLTGRLQIWLYSIFSIREHLWFGYGFESFWQDQTLTHNLGWTINHAHNMIFDILLDGGILLLVPFLMLIVTFFKNLRSLLSNPHLASVIITSFSMIILISFMEETIYVPFDLKWIYTSCLVFYVSNPGKTKNFNNYSFQIWGGS